MFKRLVKRKISLRLKTGIMVAGLIFLVVSISTYIGVGNAQKNMAMQAEKDIRAHEISVNNYIEQQQAIALNLTKMVALNPLVIAGTKAKSHEQLLAATTPLLKESGLEYMVIADPKGNTLVKTHQPDNYGDNIIKQYAIKTAVGGKSNVGIEEGKLVKLSIRTGVPIKDDTGTVIGVATAGYVFSQNSVAQRITELLGVNILITKESEVVSSSFEGININGEIKDNEILTKVLKNGGAMEQEKTISGKPYLLRLIPLKGPDGKTIGIVGMGLPLVDNIQMTNSTLRYMTIAGLILLLLGGLLGIWATGKLVKPIEVMAGSVDKIAGGDLSTDVNIYGNDEIGTLGQATKQMLEHLRDMVSRIRHSSEKINNYSKEMNLGMEQSMQASEQIAATSQEMSAGILQVSQNAQDMSHSAREAMDNVALGNAAVNKVVNQMERIKNSVNDSAQIIEGLGESSREINKIVEVIVGIAEQTNLLALNAAIEAARAGEQGKGFAVVADEVRKLAEESGRAAKDISGLIKGIQEETGRVIQSMADGMNEVEKGNEVAGQAGIALNNILAVVEKVSANSQEVAAAVQEMAAGSENVSASTEEQTATMQDLAGSTQQLAELASELQELVAQFKLQSSAAGSEDGAGDLSC